MLDNLSLCIKRVNTVSILLPRIVFLNKFILRELFCRHKIFLRGCASQCPFIHSVSGYVSAAWFWHRFRHVDSFFMPSSSLTRAGCSTVPLPSDTVHLELTSGPTRWALSPAALRPLQMPAPSPGCYLWRTSCKSEAPNSPWVRLIWLVWAADGTQDVHNSGAARWKRCTGREGEALAACALWVDHSPHPSTCSAAQVLSSRCLFGWLVLDFTEVLLHRLDGVNHWPSVTDSTSGLSPLPRGSGVVEGPKSTNPLTFVVLPWKQAPTLRYFHKVTH